MATISEVSIFEAEKKTKKKSNQWSAYAYIHTSIHTYIEQYTVIDEDL